MSSSEKKVEDPSPPNKETYELSHEQIESARYILPLVGDRAHDNNKYPLKPYQLYGWKRYICNTSNTYGYYSCNNPLTQQLFLCNLIFDYDLTTYQGTVIRYCPDLKCYTACSPMYIYILLKDSFHNKKKSILPCKHLLFNLDIPLIHRTVDFNNRWWWSLNPSVPYIRSTVHISDQRCKESVLNANHFYPNLGPAENNRTFSVIHQFFNNTELVLYSFSHRLTPSLTEEQPIIHGATRIRLRLEANCIQSFFVVFNSSLIHCGSETKYSNPTEYSGSKNPRLFGYISKEGSLLDKTSNETNTVDYSSFQFCNEMNCTTCQTAKKKSVFHGGEFVINAFDEYVCVEAKKGKDSKKNNNESVATKRKRAKSKVHGGRYFVFGDLEKYGWAVYRGIRFIAGHERDTLFIQNNLRSIIARSNSSGTYSWSTIEPGRKSYSIVSSDHVVSGRSGGDHLTGDIVNMHDRLEKRLREIKGFEKCKLYDSSVIINDGACPVQAPHRDIGSSEIVTQNLSVKSNEESNTKKAECNRVRSSTRKKSKPDRLVFEAV